MAREGKVKIPTARKLQSGNWRCQVMVNGERISVVRETAKAAQIEAMALKEQIVKRGESVRSGSITLKGAMLKYIDDRRGVLSPSTIRGYMGIVNNRLKDLQQKKVKDITEQDIQIAISKAAKEGKSAKTIKNDISLAIAALQEYKDINTKRLKYPQRDKKEHVYLQPQDIVKLFDAIAGDPAELQILLALWLGLRRSEILGLHWESVDLEGKKIKIENALVDGENGEKVYKPYMKNETSHRTLPLPDYIVNKLAKYAEPEQRQGPVFQPNMSIAYKHLRRACEKCGIPFAGLHGLRHTNASIMLSLGVIDKAAMARGGWSTDNTMRNIYQHLFDDDRKAADHLIDNYFEGLIHTEK